MLMLFLPVLCMPVCWKSETVSIVFFLLWLSFSRLTAHTRTPACARTYTHSCISCQWDWRKGYWCQNICSSVQLCYYPNLSHKKLNNRGEKKSTKFVLFIWQVVVPSDMKMIWSKQLIEYPRTNKITPWSQSNKTPHNIALRKRNQYEEWLNNCCWVDKIEPLYRNVFTYIRVESACVFNCSLCVVV